MDRETKTIKTPSGDAIVIYTYLTGREARQIDDISIGALNLEDNNKGINPKIMREAEDKIIETLVISVNGSSDNVLNIILDMKSADYTYVFNELEKIVNHDEASKKK